MRFLGKLKYLKAAEYMEELGKKHSTGLGKTNALKRPTKS